MKEHKKINTNDLQDLFKDFREHLKDKKNSEYEYESFPTGEDFIDLQNTDNSLNISYIEGKYDKAFYYSLSKIQWHLFLSIQFRKLGFKGKTESAFSRRKDWIQRIFKVTTRKLKLSNNDIQYFCFEERNLQVGSHLHIIAHCKRTDKASIESTRDTLLWLLQKLNKTVIIPPNHNLHVQKVNYTDKALKYCLKLKLDEHEKPYFHSFGFIRFYHRYQNWMKREKSKIWETISSTTSSFSGLNTKKPILPPPIHFGGQKHDSDNSGASGDAFNRSLRPNSQADTSFSSSWENLSESSNPKSESRSVNGTRLSAMDSQSKDSDKMFQTDW